MLKSLVSAVWTARFTPFVLVIAAIAATAGDAQARTPKINTLRSFVGALEPNNSVPVSVLYDEDAFDLSGTERWVTVGKGQEVQIFTNWAIDVSDGYVTDVFVGHHRNTATNKVSDLFSPWAGHEWPTVGEPAPKGVDPDTGAGSLIAGAFGDIGVNEGRQPVQAFKTIKTDELHQQERDEIVAACNAQANATNGYTAVHNYSVFLRIYTRGRRREKINYFPAACTCFGQTGCLCNQYAGYGTSRFFTVSGVVPIKIQCNRPGSTQPEEHQRKPEITNASLSIKTSGESCPKQAQAMVTVFGDGKRKVRYRIQHQVEAYTSPWFEGQIKKTKILGGEGYALVADHKLERKLGPGEKQFRLQIEEWEKDKWQTVAVACPPLEAQDVALSIAGSGEGVVCPRDTETEITARTNGPGMITFHLRAVGGANSAPYQRMAEREGDAYFARYKAQNKIHNDTDKTYEAVVKDGPVSNKATLKVSCIKPASGELTLRKKVGSKCEAEALVAIHTNVGGELPYELECGSGRSWQRTVRSSAANKIGVDRVEFAVTDKERVTCILRTRLGDELELLGSASQTFACPTLTAPRP